MELKKFVKDAGATFAITTGMAVTDAVSATIGAAISQKTGIVNITAGDSFFIAKTAGSAALGTAVLCPVPAYIATAYQSSKGELQRPRGYVALLAGTLGTLGAWATTSASAGAGAAMLKSAPGNAALAGLFGGFVIAGGTFAAVMAGACLNHCFDPDEDHCLRDVCLNIGEAVGDGAKALGSVVTSRFHRNDNDTNVISTQPRLTEHMDSAV